MKFTKMLVVFALMWSVISSCSAPATAPANSAPDSQVVAMSASTVATALPSYDFHGVSVHLNAEFPPMPETMKVYTAREEVLATTDSVRALAKQFKMNGEIYKLTEPQGTAFGMLGGDTEYLVVDGNRQLHVRSDKYFTYIPDYVSWTSQLLTVPPSNADTAIKEFMQSYGFNSAYKVEKSDTFSYAALALSPDGFDVRNEDFQFTGLNFNFNQNGIALVAAGLLSYDETEAMGIISAEEAFQKFLDPSNMDGYVQGERGGGLFMIGDTILKPEDFKKWTHVRPLDQTLNYNGYLSSTGKSVDGSAPFITLNGYTVVGNVSDIPANMQSLYIEARGQFHEANGVQTFELESWKKYDGYEENISGNLQREGDHFVLDDGAGKEYILQDVPADVPLPMEHAFVRGVTRDDIFDWQTIDNTGEGGGGGGGGYFSFYKINFSGTPVPFPTSMPPTATPEPIQKPVEGLRGTLQVKVFFETDGTEHATYGFLPYDNKYSGLSLIVKGSLDETLKAYNNRPIDVWGTITDESEIAVDRYELPYPDLQFQLISGTEKIETVDGQSVRLITADNGVTYIALEQVGEPKALNNPNESASGGGPVFSGKTTYEALIIPGESVSGYPGIRVFRIFPEIVDGTPIPPAVISIRADQPNVFPGSPAATSLTIEKIELAYFTPDQRYTNERTPNPVYVQPVWRFTGHYDNGFEIEILVQALKPEFLLPEIENVTAQ